MASIEGPGQRSEVYVDETAFGCPRSTVFDPHFASVVDAWPFHLGLGWLGSHWMPLQSHFSCHGCGGKEKFSIRGQSSPPDK